MGAFPAILASPGGMGSLGLSPKTEPEAQALFARMSVAPTPRCRNAYNQLIRRLKACGAWSKLDGFHWYAAETTQQALLNWISTSYNGTANNSPTFTAGNGYRGNGSNTSIATGYNFSTAGGRLSQNDASIGVYVIDGGSSTGADIGGLTGGSFVFLRPYTGGGKLSAYVSATGTTDFAVKNALGLSVASRTGASLTSMYRDGSLLGAPTTSSSALPNANLLVLTGDGTFSNHLVACAFWGAGLTAAQVASINHAIKVCLSQIGSGITDPVTPYGVWRGTWDSGGNGKSGSVVIAAHDVMLYSGAYYFCISGYTTSGASTAPDVDTTHWEVLPIFSQTELFSDTFETGAGAFNGRQVNGLTWYTTGAGYLNAIVVNDGVDGYATSSGNTYFVLPGMTGPVTELEAEEWDQDSPGFTLAIGGNGGANTIFEEMIHTNFSATGIAPLYWHDGASAQSFSSPKYSYSSSWVAVAGRRYICKKQIRGKFIFFFVDGIIEGILCHDMVATIGATASEVFVQCHSGAALGENRHYRVAAQKQAA